MLQGKVSVIAAPQVARTFEAEGAWMADALAGAIGPFFEQRQPIRDGFAMTSQ